MFINHTNHLSVNWSESQRQAAEKYGEIIDVPFPSISPHIESNEEIEKLVEIETEKIVSKNPNAVLVQGEFGYTYSMVTKLKKLGIRVLYATTDRVTKETVQPDGTTQKVSVFQFVRFREY